MHTIAFILRGLILIGTLAGYSFFIFDKTKLHPSFLPITILSSITLMVYIAGLLNVLNLAVLSITVVGCLLLVLYLWRFIRKRFSPRPFLCPGIVFFIVSSLYFVILLKGVFYEHYDNFSHWGTIIKEMFASQSFPTETSVVIFRNYLPGTATFIYYVCKLIGYTESHTLMAQAILVTAALTPLFCKAEWKRCISWIAPFFTAVFAVSVLSYDDGTLNIYNLLVDGVLAYLTIAAVLAIYRYRRDAFLSFVVGVPTLTMLVLTKDSGKILFVCILLLLIILWLRYQPRWFLNRRNLAELSALIAVPLFSSALWKAYIAKAYPSAAYESNKFAVSLEQLSETYQARDPEFIHQLPKMIWERITDGRLINTWVMATVLIVAVLAVLWLALNRRPFKPIIWSLAGGLALLSFYLVTLFVLYAMIMPEVEARNLAAFDRYYSTIVLVVSVLLLTACTYTVTQATCKYPVLSNVGLIICMCAMLASVSSNLPKLCNRPVRENYRRYAVQMVLDKAQPYITEQDHVLLYDGTKDNASGFYHHLLGYERLTFQNSQINRQKIESDPSALQNALRQADYLLISEDKSTFWSILNAQGIVSRNGQDGDVYRIERAGDLLQITCLA